MNTVIWACYTLITIATGQPWGSLMTNDEQWMFLMHRNAIGGGIVRQGVGSLDALPDLLKRLGLRDERRPCGSGG